MSEFEQGKEYAKNEVYKILQDCKLATLIALKKQDSKIPEFQEKITGLVITTLDFIKEHTDKI
jgi:hypothetical protein